MQRKFKVWLAGLLLTLVVVLAMPQLAQGQMRGHRMMGGPGMGMGSGRNGQTIHQLFAYHDQVQRRVDEISNGIRAVTESDNPEVAKLIQAHVSAMYDRIQRGQGIPMMGMSSTLPTLSQSARQYRRSLTLTPKGVAITETSNNPQMVAVIREHAQEVTQFVEQGMPAMMDGRMLRLLDPGWP